MPAQDYTLGRGRVVFEETGTNGFRDLGNAPEFQLSVEAENLPHFNSQGGLKKKDKDVVTQITSSATFQLDEPVNENLALFFLSTAAVSNTVAGGNVTDENVVARHDKWVALANKNVTVSTVVVTGPSGTPSYSSPADYEVLGAPGYIRAKSTGAIPDGGTIEVDYTHTGVTTNKVSIGSTTTISGKLFFLGAPATGRILDVEGKASLKPEGELPFIGDDWLAFSFTAEYLEDAAFGGLADIIERGVVT